VAKLSFQDKINVLRAGVLGANDGIISVAGVVIGVASATQENWIIFLSGMSALLAGAFSMAGGEYVSVSTQRDTEKAIVSKIEQTHHHLSPEERRKILKEDYNVEEGEYMNPWHAAASSFLSFIAGAVIPLLTIMLFPTPIRVEASIISIAIALGLTGYVSAKLGHAPVRPAIIRNVVVGMITMGVTYFFGKMV
jgi:VIT1/CCC1 family predicted Fe2+/Mn2+ transporter